MLLGPLFLQEMRPGRQRRWLEIFRRAYAGWLILQFFYFYQVCQTALALGMLPPPFGRGFLDGAIVGEFVQTYFRTLILQHFIVLALTIPTFVAGAISDEKSRGTLILLLTTDVTSWEIVAGKLLARLTQVCMILLVELPLFCFIGGYSGYDAKTLLGIVCVTIAPMFALGAASVLASVLCRQTRDAVLGLYATGAACYAFIRFGLPWLGKQLAWPLPVGYRRESIACLDPRYVFEPIGDSQRMDEFILRLGLATLVWGVIGLACLVAAVWRLRGSCASHQEGQSSSRSWRWGRRTPVGDQPLLWKECDHEGLAPMTFFRAIPRWLALVAVFLAALGLSQGLQTGDIDQCLAGFFSGDDPVLFAMVLGCLCVAVRSSGSISGERERRTWEGLLLTPLETRELIEEKHQGILWAAYPYLLAFALAALLLAISRGFMAILWEVMTLAVTWSMMHLMAISGISYSAQASSSWRSLLMTLVFGYGYCWLAIMFVFAATAIFALVLVVLFLAAYAAVLVVLPKSLFSMLLIGVVDGIWQFRSSTVAIMAFSLAFSLTLYYMRKIARAYLDRAEQWVARRERSRRHQDHVPADGEVGRYLDQWRERMTKDPI